MIFTLKLDDEMIEMGYMMSESGRRCVIAKLTYGGSLFFLFLFFKEEEEENPICSCLASTYLSTICLF